MKKKLLFLSFVVLLTGISCSRSSSGTTSVSHKDTQELYKKYAPEFSMAREARETYSDGSLRSDHRIGDVVPFSLVLINGARCYDFPEAVRDGHLREFSQDELKQILKKKNLILDNVIILKDEKSLEKYRKGGFVESHIGSGIRFVYEIKAHPIDSKGEIFNNVWKFPEFPGGNEAYTAFLEKNVRHPKELLHVGVHGFVDVECVIEKDGKIEAQKVYAYLKDQSGSPCLDSTIIKRYEQEALRIVKMMPRCELGKTENGDSVRVNHHIALVFDE